MSSKLKSRRDAERCRGTNPGTISSKEEEDGRERAMIVSDVHSTIDGHQLAELKIIKGLFRQEKMTNSQPNSRMRNYTYTSSSYSRTHITHNPHHLHE